MKSVRMVEGNDVESENIVIVGGGICGIATALALHRKGIKSLVLERSKSLRATGVAIVVHNNGWCALDQLGVASDLRKTAVPILSGKFLSFDDDKLQEVSQLLGKHELRCLKRMDLIECLAAHLPNDTVRFGCNVTSIEMDSLTSSPVLHLDDGTSLNAKAVIGCDGVNSTISNMIEVKATNQFKICVIRGFTSYPNGHELGSSLKRMTKDETVIGMMPVTINLVYWWITKKNTYKNSYNISKSQILVKEIAVEAVNGYPSSFIETVTNCSIESLHLTDYVRYITPWDILRKRFRQGTMAVAGDALHAMPPFMAQGGSAGLEDAVVLARCLARNIGRPSGASGGGIIKTKMVEKALDEYLNERKPRIFWLSLQLYLIGKMSDTSSRLIKFLCVGFTTILFRDFHASTRYDCGSL